MALLNFAARPNAQPSQPLVADTLQGWSGDDSLAAGVVSAGAASLP